VRTEPLFPIEENIAKVRERIAAAARRAGRDPEEIRLVAVSKTVDPARIRRAIEAGVKILGENYVQEAGGKIHVLGRGVAWHFIGHLQSNKAKAAVRLFDWIHTVDRISLAQALDRAALREGKKLPVLLQIRLAGEPTKSGTAVDEIFPLLAELSRLENLAVKGLMALPPFFEDPEESRPFFRELKKWSEQIAGENIPGISMEELSMGMSNDFEVAIEEGATLVRVGTAIFGPRTAEGG
jgi:pyridoxal phosphate enzyme (YggS family)